jgi:hypothetical protein
MDYGEAISVLERAKETFEFPVRWGIELQSEHERYLTEKHAKKPVIVMNYPKDIKAFYMRVNDDNRTVAAMDVLSPGIGEIVGGSQREERLDALDARTHPTGLLASWPIGFGVMDLGSESIFVLHAQKYVLLMPPQLKLAGEGERSGSVMTSRLSHDGLAAEYWMAQAGSLDYAV